MANGKNYVHLVYLCLLIWDLCSSEQLYPLEQDLQGMLIVLVTNTNVAIMSVTFSTCSSVRLSSPLQPLSQCFSPSVFSLRLLYCNGIPLNLTRATCIPPQLSAYPCHKSVITDSPCTFLIVMGRHKYLSHLVQSPSITCLTPPLGL